MKLDFQPDGLKPPPARAEKAEAELAAIRAHMAARPLSVGMADTPCGGEVEISDYRKARKEREQK